MERKNAHSTNRDGLLLRSESSFVLQWGSRKRLRCMKVHGKDPSTKNDPTGSRPVHRATARVDRRAVRSGININNSNRDSMPNQQNNSSSIKSGHGHLNLRQRPASPSRRILRNSEGSIGMKRNSNGVRGLASPDRKVTSISNNNNNNRKNNNIDHYNNDSHHGSGGSGSSEIAHDGKRSGSPGGEDTVAAMWLPKFAIALTNKEKEEDFMAIKGSKLPQRPKKRAKLIQRTLNLVSPGAWLCDLTLERYEVREKKVSKKRPRGLKAMGNVESDSE
ncbi:hypothetical protein CASFOL_011141 [Castilleja foliolosa]|uniref:DUF1639 family protein n=1 Tax=Castilleja foliolosa TaxID=1961234 RepID=A0ABD3DW15_9LAMI